jgi:hypothetical protein
MDYEKHSEFDATEWTMLAGQVQTPELSWAIGRVSVGEKVTEVTASPCVRCHKSPQECVTSVRDT